MKPLQSTTPLLLAAAAALFLTACDVRPATGTPARLDTIDVSGTGTVKAVPDRFRVSAVSSRVGTDINAMKQEVDAEINAAIKAAEALQIDRKQISALSVSIQPEWQWQPERKLIGHRVARQIDFAADGVEAYAELLQQLAELGFTEVHQASAEIRDPEALEQEALKRAVADARARAELLAEAAGRTLGEAIQISVSGGPGLPPTPMPMMAMAAAEASARSADQYSAGETSVVQSVSIRFVMKP